MPYPRGPALESGGCPVAGCGRPIKAKGLCNAHYKRLRLYGSPVGTPPYTCAGGCDRPVRWANARCRRCARIAWGDAPANRVRLAEHEARRRARKAGSEARVTLERVAVYHHSAGACGICGRLVDPADFHIDHVVPLALGGPHTYDNVQAAHPACNLSKGDRLMVAP